jgi:predicted phage terminase large subunit-like protein
MGSFDISGDQRMSFVDPRQPGEALWPSKYPLEELRRRRASMGAYDWSALFQQRPAPAGGGLFRAEWFADRFLDVAPAIMRVARGWDTAGTEGAGDWTVGVKIGEEFLKNPHSLQLESTGRYVVLDVQRQQLGPDGVDKLIKVTAQLDGVACAQREEREGGSAGLAVIAARTKTLREFDYKGVPTTGSKITRSKMFRGQAEAGNVYLIRASWNKAYIDELTGFPTATHDDQVDASSCAYNAVLLEPTPEEEFVSW